MSSRGRGRMPEFASLSQLNFIEQLRRKRIVPPALAGAIQDSLQAHYSGAEQMSGSTAAELIDFLNNPDKCPPTPQAIEEQRRADTGEAADLGMYRKSGKIYTVHEFVPKDEKTGRRDGPMVRYAKHIRFAPDGINYKEDKAPWMQNELTAADLMPREEYIKIRTQLGKCLVCWRNGQGCGCEARQPAAPARPRRRPSRKAS